MLKILLLPFAIIYGTITGIRNKLFDWGIIKSKSFNIPIISIGNINMGGTGKSPHIEYLVRLLQSNNNVATLSRGYKRKTKGFKLVKQQATALEVGDEPAQFKHKFRNITVAVDEKRVHGVKKLQELDPYLNVVLLDDAFQHRYIKPGLSILLTDFHNTYNNDYLFPSGTLRESRSGAKRADIIIITKMPKVLSPITKRRLYNEIKPKEHQELFTTYLKYGKLNHVFKKSPVTKAKKFSTIIMVSGIANPYPLEEHLRRKCNELITLSYKDHHNFSKKDILNIKKIFDNTFTKNKAIITTEKDAMRIMSAEGNELIKELPLYYISVEIGFHKEQKQKFDRIIKKYVRKNSENK
ncbi:MAG: tetraacyldisaccharide 4'-kinase [Bacteroidota bacterium]|nr:tetraacyldisaccharide 4'-kinase [Bacteroidota bacterium]